MEARFNGRPFAPHRHDTYAIGITLSGVQCFHYRGTRWDCLPGQCHILHPDELHDGMAGTDQGFSYRILYLDPVLLRPLLDRAPLPFVPAPVVDARHLSGALLSGLWNLEEETDEEALIDAAALVTPFLLRLAGWPKRPVRPLPIERLLRARDLIAATPAHRQPITELEAVTGLDRWTFARHFRSAFGTSPRRFRTMRQLDATRRALLRGVGLVQAALEAGFSDQSHMARAFKQAYGLTPAVWRAAFQQEGKGR